MAIQRIVHKCGLYDMLAIPGGDTDAQLRDTFMRGKQERIDHVLGSQWFVDARWRFGALEFNNGIVSDHRGLFIDFELKILFAGQMKGNFNVTTRGLTSKNDKKVQKYMDKLEEYWKDHKISGRVQRLNMEATMMVKPEIHHRYDVINRDIMRGMLAME